MRDTTSGLRMGYRFALAGGTSLFVFTNLSAAQPTDRSAQPLPQAASAQFEEIIVTAQRRSENVQKIPLAITAISADTLRTQGVADVRAIAEFTPSVRIRTSGEATDINIRGIGNNSFGANGDPAAAFNVDGIYRARPLAPTAILYDLERVEVLRGPQGTLYGRNADAGAVNVISNKPVFTFGVGGEIELGNYNGRRFAGNLNVPLSDTLAVRVAFQTVNHDGYVSNGTFDADTKAVRAHILWKPDSRTSLLVSGDYAKRGGLGSQQIVPIVPKPADPWSTPIPATGFSLDGTEWSTTLKGDHDFGGVTATILANYQNQDDDQRGAASGTTYTSQIEHARQQSVEARLASSRQDNFYWTAGLYYFREKQSYLLNFQLSPTLASYTNYPDMSTISKAAFGQATYRITPRVRVTGGLRYTNDKKTSENGTFGVDDFLGVGSAGPGTILTAAPTVADKTWNNTSWKVAVDVDLAKDVLGYASISTGYKAGGFFSGLAPTNTYGPETLTSYAVGLKSKLFDRRVQFNAEVFYWNYKDYQVSLLGNLPSPPNAPSLLSLLTYNAGAAQIYGLETETAWLPTANDRFDLNLAYLHAKFTDFVTPGLPGLSTGDFSGQRLPQAPRWSGTVGYRHSFHLANGVLDVSIQTHFESKQYLRYYYENTNGGTTQPAYERSDVFLTYRFGKDRWRLTAYVKNVENRAVINNSIQGATDPTLYYGELDPPRTYGAILGFQL